MKKMMAVGLLVLFVLQAPVLFAAERGSAEYEKLKEYKRAQREQREAERALAHSGQSSGPSFWQKEGERSGLNQIGPNMMNFVKGLNPAPFFKEQNERYRQRKSAG